MSLGIQVDNARHPKALAEYFDIAMLDAFHDAGVLGVVHGGGWTSVLVTDGGKAFFHAFAKRAIGETGCFDVDPVLGSLGCQRYRDAIGGAGGSPSGG